MAANNEKSAPINKAMQKPNDISETETKENKCGLNMGTNFMI